MTASKKTKPALPKSLSPIPKYLVRQYDGWRAESFAENKAWFARLAQDGQHPRAMLISCCDSRIDTVNMFGAEPGDLFVVRNVANLVPPYSPDHQHHGTSAAVEYAVNVLKVAHIVVIGHSNCGGVQACHDMCTGAAPELEEKSSFIGRWMDILRDGCEAVIAEGHAGGDLTKRLEHEAVLTSLRNLETFPFVASSVEKGVLSLHGAWVDIGTGVLHTAMPDGNFQPVR
ncbi:carbonic anhydrase [Rhodobacteraceae bacterium NNCM2]|nr:carbonic anhydrase [Coraliihabitans acroporae]